MKKSFIAILGIAALGLLLTSNAGYACDPNDLYTLQTTNACPHCDLSGVDLTGMPFGRVDLNGANLSGATLIGINLSNSDADGANLSGANLNAANLTGTDLSGANLTGANLSGATVSGTNLTGAKLDNATWTDGNTCLPGSIDKCNK